MFRRQNQTQKKLIKVEGDEGSQKQRLDERAGVCETPPGKMSSRKNRRTTYWLHRLFGCAVNKNVGSSKTETNPSEQQREATLLVHPPQEKNRQKKKRGKYFWGLFNCCRRNKVSPVSDDDTKDHQKSSLQKDTEIQKNQSDKERDTAVKEPTEPAVAHSVTIRPISTVKRITFHDAMFYGFPNPSTICYMNASLQSLLTLKEFIEDIKAQEDVIPLGYDALIMRNFLNVVKCHSLSNSSLKFEAIMQLKRLLSFKAPEFVKGGMKDAHEFLTAVLDQMRNVPLTEMPTSTGKNYSCPVQKHLLFTMQNTRTCKGCGVKSMREEDFTMLSLDLIAGGSVCDMLDMHQMEKELEFRCDCGAKSSGLESKFRTLPNYLILHLKRFKFTENQMIVKLEDPINLCREMTVAAQQGSQRYGLVSVISHIGSSGKKGHYVSDGLHPQHSLEDGQDRWLHYNDIYVLETTGASVSELCAVESYILIYQRR